MKKKIALTVLFAIITCISLIFCGCANNGEDAGSNNNANQDQPVGSVGLEYTLNSDGQTYSVSGIGSCTNSNIVIPSKYNGKYVTSIGECAFFNSSIPTKVTIPNSIASIDFRAFSYCNRLTRLIMPSSVTCIRKDAFYGCVNLVSVNYIGSIDDWAQISFVNEYANPLYYAHALYVNDILATNVILSTKINDYVFDSCSSITSAIIANGVTSIGASAFIDCSSLTSISIPDSVTSIGRGAFGGCGSLTRITIPDSLTSIDTYAFSSCSSLTSIIIPNSVTSIGTSAFSNCSNLVSIFFTGTKEQWNAISKDQYWNKNTGSYTIHCTDGDIAKQ